MIETGIYFGDIHSYYDLNLVLSSVTIPPATPKTNYIDIPGGDGSIDLTEAHGEIKYKNRECTFVFTVSPDDDLTFEERKMKVSTALNGVRCKIILDKDPNWYYNGRCTINEYKQDKNLLQITITATAEPYKYKLGETVATFAVSESTLLATIKNERKTVVPVIECDIDVQVIFEASVFQLNTGRNRILEINLKPGENKFQLMGIGGEGTIRFTFQEGAL